MFRKLLCIVALVYIIHDSQGAVSLSDETLRSLREYLEDRERSQLVEPVETASVNDEEDEGEDIWMQKQDIIKELVGGESQNLDVRDLDEQDDIEIDDDDVEAEDAVIIDESLEKGNVAQERKSIKSADEKQRRRFLRIRSLMSEKVSKAEEYKNKADKRFVVVKLASDGRRLLIVTRPRPADERQDRRRRRRVIILSDEILKDLDWQLLRSSDVAKSTVRDYVKKAVRAVDRQAAVNAMMALE